MTKGAALRVPKSRFKPRAFEYFRLVEQGRQEIVVTDHGRPVARIIPVAGVAEPGLEELRGSVVKYLDPYEPVGADEWEAGR